MSVGAAAPEDAAPLRTRPLDIGLLGAGFVVASELLHTLGRVTASRFDHPFLVVGVLADPGALVMMTTLCAVAWWLRRDRWDRLAAGGEARAVALACVAVLTVTTVFYEPNAWLGHSHVLTRAVLLAGAVACVRRPSAVAPFVGLAVIVTSQFEHPIGGFTWTDKRIVYDLLLLLVVVMVASRLRRASEVELFVPLASAVLASWYVAAGAEKLATGWIANDRLGNLVVAAHLDGWLRWLGPEPAIAVAGFVNRWALPINLATVAVEMGALALLSPSPRVRRLVLAALIGFHISVFALTGIAFWKWVVIEVVMFAVASHRRLDRSSLLMLLVVTVVLVLVHVPVRLSWFDTPVVQAFEFHLVGADGGRRQVHEAEFRPYSVQFAQGRFGYLTDEPIAVGTFGAVVDPEVAAAADGVTSVQAAQAFLDAGGSSPVDPARTDAFDEFVRAVVAGDRPWFPLPAIAPPHIVTTPGSGGDVDEPVALEVVLVGWWFDGEEVHELRSRVVHVVALEGD